VGNGIVEQNWPFSGPQFFLPGEKFELEKGKIMFLFKASVDRE
jgi:hypothetical protein